MIISLGHKRNRGKGLLANFLVKEYGFIEVAFADPIKDISMSAFDWHNKEFNEGKEIVDSRWGISPRAAFQRVGTMFRKEFGADFWIKSLLSHIDNLTKANPRYRYVISDMRFTNEAEALLGRGAFLVKVERDVPYIHSIDSHQSEIDLDNFDKWHATLYNGTEVALPTLYKVMESLVNSFTEIESSRNA
jgi:hypothetical protein